MQWALAALTSCFAGMVVCVVGLLAEVEAAVVIGALLTLPATVLLGVLVLAAVIGQPLAYLLRLASGSPCRRRR